MKHFFTSKVFSINLIYDIMHYFNMKVLVLVLQDFLVLVLVMLTKTIFRSCSALDLRRLPLRSFEELYCIARYLKGPQRNGTQWARIGFLGKKTS